MSTGVRVPGFGSMFRGEARQNGRAKLAEQAATTLQSRSMPSAPYRSVYAYPWDVMESGPTKFADVLASQRLTEVTIAVSYHAGKFLRTRGGSSRVYFPEDGTVYFEPSLKRYGRIKPVPHPDEKLRQVAAELVQADRLGVHAWTVVFHNSRLGNAYPDATVRNAWGDRYPYSLCPVNPEVAEFGLALVQDLSRSLPVASIVLETIGFLPYTHGYHHEFAQTKISSWMGVLLALCFCDHCLNESKREAGIDSHALRKSVVSKVDNYLRSPVDVSADVAAVWTAADILSDEELSAYLKWRSRRVSELVKQIRAGVSGKLAIIPTIQRPTASTWIEGSDIRALTEIVDYLEVPFYEPTAQRAIADAWDTLHRSGNDPTKIRAILRPGTPDLADGQELAEAVQGISQLGIRDFAFYNWGLLRKHDFERIGPALSRV
jgi:hypothetical protein